MGSAKFKNNKSSSRRGRMEQAQMAKRAGRDPVQEAKRYVMSANPENENIPEFLPTAQQYGGGQQQQQQYYGQQPQQQQMSYEQQQAQAMLGPVQTTDHTQKPMQTGYIDPSGPMPAYMEGLKTRSRFGDGGGVNDNTPTSGRFAQRQHPLLQQQRGGGGGGGGQQYSDVTVINNSELDMKVIAFNDDEGTATKLIPAKHGDAFKLPYDTVITLVPRGETESVIRQRINQPSVTLTVTKDLIAQRDRIRWVVIGLVSAVGVVAALAIVYLVYRYFKKRT